MLRRRVIVCLDVAAGRVVKGTRFQDLRDVGDPAAAAARCEAEGADEVVFLDVSASHEGRGPLLDAVGRAAERLTIPLTVGGGIAGVADARALLRAGADKVAVNSAAVARPALLAELAAEFGRQCVVASVDAARGQVVTHGARRPTGLCAVAWAATCARGGAGEILLTSVEQDGARNGYDLALTRRVAGAVTVPVIASGGAGTAAHLLAAFREGGADAALVAGIFHDGSVSLREIKRTLAAAGLPVRPIDEEVPA